MLSTKMSSFNPGCLMMYLASIRAPASAILQWLKSMVLKPWFSDTAFKILFNLSQFRSLEVILTKRKGWHWHFYSKDLFQKKSFNLNILSWAHLSKPRHKCLTSTGVIWNRSRLKKGPALRRPKVKWTSLRSGRLLNTPLKGIWSKNQYIIINIRFILI